MVRLGKRLPCALDPGAGNNDADYHAESGEFGKSGYEYKRHWKSRIDLRKDTFRRQRRQPSKPTKS
jgi:hypothetical protein